MSWIFAPWHRSTAIAGALICVLGTCGHASAADISCVATTSASELRAEAENLQIAATAAGFTNVRSPKFAFGKADNRQICHSALLTGDLTKDDIGQVADFLRQNAYAQRIYLYDVSGDRGAAMAVGRGLREGSLGTVAPLAADGSHEHAVLMRRDVHTMTDLCIRGKPCLCAGACAYVWAGGVTRAGNVVTLDPEPRGEEISLVAESKSYLEDMDLAPAALIHNRGGDRATYADFRRVRYPAAIRSAIDLECGGQPQASGMASSQLLAPGEAKPMYRAQLAQTYQAWHACVDLVTFRTGAPGK